MFSLYVLSYREEISNKSGIYGLKFQFFFSAYAGLALVYVIQTLTMTQYAVRKTSEVENYMTSVERVMTYTKLDREPGYEEEQTPLKEWPRRGSSVLRDISLIFYPGGTSSAEEYQS